MTNHYREAEKEIAALLDRRVRACRAIVRCIRATRLPTRAMLDKADDLERLADTCTEISDHLSTLTVGEFLALASARREIWSKS